MNSGLTSMIRRAKQSRLRHWIEAGLFSRTVRPYFEVHQRKRFNNVDEALSILAGLTSDPELVAYHKNHLERYLTSMEYVADLPSTTRVLEVGAWPHGMTMLLRHYLFEDISTTGYLEKAEDQLKETGQRHVSLTDPVRGTSLSIDEPLFNLEIHRWPFPDHSFDLIISCETFEHLGLDPMHAYAEANRILRPGGRLFVSVPNGASVENGVRYLMGRQPNSFPYYRPEGFSLRHPREPTLDEIRLLFKSAGFQTEVAQSIHITAPPVVSSTTLAALRFVGGPLEHRRETIMARGLKVGDVLDRYPVGCQLYYRWDVDRFHKRETMPRD
jgi:SAM-dependent methyltransferase